MSTTLSGPFDSRPTMTTGTTQSPGFRYCQLHLLAAGNRTPHWALPLSRPSEPRLGMALAPTYTTDTKVGHCR